MVTGDADFPEESGPHPNTLAEIDALLLRKHYGPGEHPGTGSPQQAHAGGESPGDAAFDMATSAAFKRMEDYLHSISLASHEQTVVDLKGSALHELSYAKTFSSLSSEGIAKLDQMEERVNEAVDRQILMLKALYAKTAPGSAMLAAATTPEEIEAALDRIGESLGLDWRELPIYGGDGATLGGLPLHEILGEQMPLVVGDAMNPVAHSVEHGVFMQTLIRSPGRFRAARVAEAFFYAEHNGIFLPLFLAAQEPAHGAMPSLDGIRPIQYSEVGRHRRRIDLPPLTDKEFRRLWVNIGASEMKKGVNDALSSMVKEAVPEADKRGVERFVRTVIDEWAKSSSGGSKVSMAMQFAAAEKYGQSTKALEESVRRSNPHADLLIEDARDWLDRHRSVAMAYLDAEYDLTQRFFRAEGVTHVQVYRGTSRPYSEAGEAIHRWEEMNHPATPQLAVRAQPLESWTTRYDTARDFQGSGKSDVVTMTLGAIVPVENVVASCRSGRGCLDEEEVVVVGMDGATVSVMQHEHQT